MKDMQKTRFRSWLSTCTIELIILSDNHIWAIAGAIGCLSLSSRKLKPFLLTVLFGYQCWPKLVLGRIILIDLMSHDDMLPPCQQRSFWWVLSLPNKSQPLGRGKGLLRLPPFYAQCLLISSSDFWDDHYHWMSSMWGYRRHTPSAYIKASS